MQAVGSRACGCTAGPASRAPVARRGRHHASRAVCRGSATASASTSPGPEALAAFERWMAANGADLAKGGLAVSQGPGGPAGLRLVATRDVKPGDLLAAVPEAMGVGRDAAAAELGPVVVGEAMEDWVAVALLLLREKFRPVNPSVRGPWMALIPYPLPGSAGGDATVLWSESELEELQGSSLASEARAVRGYVAGVHADVVLPLVASGALPDDPFADGDKFLWAFVVLRTRTRVPYAGVGNGGKPLRLLPGLDLLAHNGGSTPGGLAVVDPPGGGLFGGSGPAGKGNAGLKCIRSAAAGETVGVDYTLASLDKASTRLTLGDVAAQYGFCAGTSGFSVDLELDEADPNLYDKADILQLAGLQGYEGSAARFTLGALDAEGKEQSDDLFIRFLRLAVLGGGDAFHLEAIFRAEVWENHLWGALSAENEAAALEAALGGLEGALASYSTSAADDAALLATETAGTRKHIALRVRIGEKEVLGRYIDVYKGLLADLDQESTAPEFYAERRLKALGLLDATGTPPAVLPDEGRFV